MAQQQQQAEGKPLEGLKVAIVVSDLFEQAELVEPKKALEAAGAQTQIISDHGPTVRGMHHDQHADEFPVDLALKDADPDDFDALVLPGGALNADALRMAEDAQQFVQAFDAARKPIGVICHGPWLMVSAGLVPNRTLTSWPTLQDDIRNAGGTWVDREVVVDGNWVSSRKPDDLPAFDRELIAAIASAPGLTPDRMPITE
jgi:protease I